MTQRPITEQQKSRF